MNKNHHVLVSVGMPVHNGEKYLNEALDSILNQTFKDFELIISDNASTDRTEIICRHYANLDPRIKYFRKSYNVGVLKNFLFLLDEAKSKYFIWAAVDDKRSQNFLEENLFFLENNPDFVASTSPTRFEGKNFDQISMGDMSLDQDSSGERIKNFYNQWHANARFYSLFRREVLIQYPYMNEQYLGCDWTWVIFLAKQGKLKRLKDGWVELGVSGHSNSSNIFKSNMKNLVDWLFPFWRLSKHTLIFLKKESFSYYLPVCLSLLGLNLSAFKLQLRYWVINSIMYKCYKKYNVCK